jgi:hypothetical protein
MVTALSGKGSLSRSGPGLMFRSNRGVPRPSGWRGARLFPTAFVHFFVMFSVFNVLDWLVPDWLIVVIARFLIFQAQGHGWLRDYAFHFQGFQLASRHIGCEPAPS